MAGAPIGQVIQGLASRHDHSITPEGFASAIPDGCAAAPSRCSTASAIWSKKLGMPIVQSAIASLNPAKNMDWLTARVSLKSARMPTASSLLTIIRPLRRMYADVRSMTASRDTDLFNPEFYREMKVEDQARTPFALPAASLRRRTASLTA